MLFAAGLNWRNGSQVWRELVGFERLDGQREQAQEGYSKVNLSVRAIHCHRHGQHFSSLDANDVNGLAHSSALSHNVLDNKHSLARRYLETTPQRKFAI